MELHHMLDSICLCIMAAYNGGKHVQLVCAYITNNSVHLIQGSHYITKLSFTSANQSTITFNLGDFKTFGKREC